MGDVQRGMEMNANHPLFVRCRSEMEAEQSGRVGGYPERFFDPKGRQAFKEQSLF